MANELMDRRQDWLDSLVGDDFFKNFGKQFFAMSPETDNMMQTDVKETDQAYQLTVDLPGLEKKDIHIDYQNETLKISAKRDSFDDHSDADGNVVQSERHYGRFSRQFYLPAVDRTKISAKYDNGVLNLELPKQAEQATAANRIEIQ
ncbi:Hsp20/alpha crystallin family protein [Latilactobacillus fuchuensis]|uniref:Heat shock protein 20 n=1 Tax=Latilactobacillus fuchuensis TaxID=164393 RepID=A0A2N9DXW3_9LACO|nr:Hsp20/alpha crystallin family protein [Latilactobacillus fuchuensis]SPC39657.1 Heat shock protein 20 [Latilactobacillus fuchuensis]